MYLISIGKKVAVLAVDPTSPITGGSILGDKTRMTELTASYSAFIRPSPSSGSLGGVARKTRDTIILCEKAGYDVILVETVGVGQSEVAVESMTDFFLLLLLANAGDELQGIKKGIMEMADLILINKADGDNKIKAENARTEFENAIKLFKPKYKHWNAKVQTVSSLEKTKIELVWQTMQEFVNCSEEIILENRKKQNQNWLWSSVRDPFERELIELKNSNLEIESIEKKYLRDEVSLRTASSKILEKYKNTLIE
jgi:LAO/AO transport system kinase